MKTLTRPRGSSKFEVVTPNITTSLCLSTPCSVYLSLTWKYACLLLFSVPQITFILIIMLLNILHNTNSNMHVSSNVRHARNPHFSGGVVQIGA